MESGNRGGHPNGSGQGVRLRALSAFMMAASILAFVVLLVITNRSMEGYRHMHVATERYIACQQNAIMFQESSDYLTSECRYFVITGELSHAENFFEEIDVTRRRENAIEAIDDFLQEESYAYLTRALEYSNQLVSVESRAMRLAAQSHGLDAAALPEHLRAVELTREELALSGQAMRLRAIDMVFGDAYMESKANIRENVEKSIETLVNERRKEQIVSSERLNALLNQQFALICVLMILMCVVVISVHILITRPLAHCVASIRNQQMMRPDGAYELRFLARSYNEMFEKNTRSTEALSYSATHDALTGVYNRRAYDAACREVDQSAVCALIADVDNFKSFNDTFGHDVGDKVLQRVAQVLQASFRAEDYVCRIGGDEFSVIMKHADSRLRDVVLNKITHANEMLQQPQDGLPQLSLSVGVAFGDRANPAGDIFKDADTALYRVKSRGGKGCEIY